LEKKIQKGNFTNELRNGQYFIIQSSLKITLHDTSIYRVQERKKKLVWEANPSFYDKLLTLASMTSFSNLACTPRLSQGDDK